VFATTLLPHFVDCQSNLAIRITRQSDPAETQAWRSTRLGRAGSGDGESNLTRHPPSVLLYPAARNITATKLTSAQIEFPYSAPVSW
jgi:hypothetical protein